MTTNSLIYSDKTLARRELSGVREGIPDRQAYSDMLCNGIAMLDEYAIADTILLYFPTRSEPNLLALAEAAWAAEKKVAFPISRTESCTLDFRQVGSLSELAKGAYGIREPSESARTAALCDRTLCVVPALAIDREGYRLGYGKGYYDRFLSSFEGNAVVALHSSLICERLARNDTDIPIKTIITETGAIRLK